MLYDSPRRIRSGGAVSGQSVSPGTGARVRVGARPSGLPLSPMTDGAAVGRRVSDVTVT